MRTKHCFGSGMCGGDDAFVAKFVAKTTMRSEITLEASVQFGSPRDDVVADVSASKESGILWILGHTKGTVGPCAAHFNCGDVDLFVTVLGVDNLSVKDSLQIGNSGNEFASALALSDDSDTAYAVGWSTASAVFGECFSSVGCGNRSASISSVVITKFTFDTNTSSLRLVWARDLRTATESERSSDLLVLNGRILLAGTRLVADVSGNISTLASRADLFVMSLNPDSVELNDVSALTFATARGDANPIFARNGSQPLNARKDERDGVYVGFTSHNSSSHLCVESEECGGLDMVVSRITVTASGTLSGAEHIVRSGTRNDETMRSLVASPNSVSKIVASGRVDAAHPVCGVSQSRCDVRMFVQGNDDMLRETSYGVVVIYEDVRCEPGAYPDPGLGCRSCPPGTYSPYGGRCLQCPDGAKCTRRVPQTFGGEIEIGSVLPYAAYGHRQAIGARPVVAEAFYDYDTMVFGQCHLTRDGTMPCVGAPIPEHDKHVLLQSSVLSVLEGSNTENTTSLSMLIEMHAGRCIDEYRADHAATMCAECSDGYVWVDSTCRKCAWSGGLMWNTCMLHIPALGVLALIISCSVQGRLRHLSRQRSKVQQSDEIESDITDDGHSKGTENRSGQHEYRSGGSGSSSPTSKTRPSDDRRNHSLSSRLLSSSGSTYDGRRKKSGSSKRSQSGESGDSSSSRLGASGLFEAGEMGMFSSSSGSDEENTGDHSSDNDNDDDGTPITNIAKPSCFDKDTWKQRVIWDESNEDVQHVYDASHDVGRALAHHDNRETVRLERMAIVGYLKIMWTFFQLINGPIHTLRVAWPPIARRVLEIYGFVDLHAVVVWGLRCFDIDLGYSVSVAVIVSVPAALVFAAYAFANAIYLCVSRKSMRRRRLQKIRQAAEIDFSSQAVQIDRGMSRICRCVTLRRLLPSSALQISTWVIWFTVIPATREALRLFDCVALGNESVLRSEPSIICGSESYVLIAAGAAAYVVLVTCGSVLGMFIFLKWKKRQLREQKVLLKWIRNVKTLQYLNGEYRHTPICWYWGVIDLATRIFVCCVLVLCPHEIGSCGLALVALLCLIVLSCYVQPLSESRQNALYIVSLGSAATLHFLALVIQIGGTERFGPLSRSSAFEWICTIIVAVVAALPYVIGVAFLTLHVNRAKGVIRGFVQSTLEFDRLRNTEARAARLTVSTLTEPMGDLVLENQRLNGQIVKLGATMRRAMMRNRVAKDAKGDVMQNYRTKKSALRTLKRKIKILRGVLEKFETRNHHLTLMRQRAEIQDEEGDVDEDRPETPIENIPKRARRGLVGAMEHKTFLTTVDIGALKQRETNVLILQENDDSDGASSSPLSDFGEE
eukprot:g61.t1